MHKSSHMNLSTKQVEEFQVKILSWYKNNGRDFPWRNTSDPYKILVSEFLLQKTHVRKVEEVYSRLITQYPSINDLAIAQVDNVKLIIKPLGFVNRAERLINISKQLKKENNSQIPQNYDALIHFNGVGKYIATAVLIFAFEEKRVIVDTNVIKLFFLEFGYKSDNKRPRMDNILWDFAQSLCPNEQVKEFNWGLLDYGATIK